MTGEKVFVLLLVAAIALMGIPATLMVKAAYQEAMENGGAHNWGRAIAYTAMAFCYGAMVVFGGSMLAQAFGMD